MALHKVYVLPKVFGDEAATKKPFEQGVAFSIEGNYSVAVVRRAATSLLANPITDDFWVDGFAGLHKRTDFETLVEVSFLPGVTDNLAATAKEGLLDFLGAAFDGNTSIQTATLYCVRASKGEIRRRWLRQWHNPIVQQAKLLTVDEAFASPAGASISAKKASAPATKNLGNSNKNPYDSPYEAIKLPSGTAALRKISEERFLALSDEEMKAIRAYYGRKSTQKSRRELGLPADSATDVELEALAQTWSEHCKHKIFGATIWYAENGEPAKEIRSIYKTYIQGATKRLLPRRPDVLSVFSDNAGVFRFDANWAICVKVETHNTPCALEPYGGAMTGIVGVHRDILGTGSGAKPLFNTDVFCFADPRATKKTTAATKNFTAPSHMLSEVHRGLRDGANQSGVPTINGAMCFDDSFLRRPLVFCGSGGVLPAPTAAENTVAKRLLKGDLIAMVGGRIGKDGIHGATLSSKSLEGTAPVAAVQIGDPITQKKMTDYLLEARDKKLFRTLTDNGAGGLSSSVGELATLSNGCELHLDQAPLKYEGLRPWEILVSEAQERMTLAVPPTKKNALQKLASKHDVEVSFLGKFTDTGQFLALHKKKPVASLPMTFLHDGFPTLQLRATWDAKPKKPPTAKATKNLAKAKKQFKTRYGGSHAKLLRAVLGRPNVASKEFWVRQYDQEVQGRTIKKPFEGFWQDAPMDAAVLRPLFNSAKGLVVACGINPKYTSSDSYHMAQSCVDEALRNFVCVGGDPKTAVGLDNFCWPDPVGDEQKLGQLVRCNQGLFRACLDYQIPLISGKDSMKNDAWEGGKKFSIVPTLLFTLVGTMPDVAKAVTSPFKGRRASGNREESLVAVVGRTTSELDCGELFGLFGLLGGDAPRVDARLNAKVFSAMHEASTSGLLLSCHDLSDGGLITALAESAFGGMVGCDVSIDELAPLGDPLEALYSESQGRFLVEVAEKDATKFKKLFAKKRLGDLLCFLGKTESTKPISRRSLKVFWRKKILMDAPLAGLKKAWKNALVPNR